MLISATTASWLYDQDGGYVPMVKSIQRLAEAGFDGVDLNFSFATDSAVFKDGIEINAPDWQGEIEKIANALKKNHIIANQSHAPFYNVLDPASENAGFREEMIRRSIIASGTLNAKWVVMHAGTVPDSSTLQTSLLRNYEYLKPHLDLALRHGTGIAVENLLDQGSDRTGRGRRLFSGYLDDILELVDKLASEYPNIGICWDTGHANNMSINQVDAVHKIGKRLKCLHVHDNNGVLDDHTLPFTGTVQWPPLMRALKETGYNGDLTYEHLKFTWRLPDELLNEALHFSVTVAKHLVSLAS
jgi:sugar phosphate isomerase/epimerase